ncbi:MAG: urease accessory protein UreD [Pseudomonadota bacterium]
MDGTLLEKSLETNDRALPRAIGVVRVGAKSVPGQTVLDRLYQKGSAKALLPRTFEADLTAVLLNTSGGVTGGDRFEYSADALTGSHLTLTTQAAERAYRALPGQTGRIETRLTAAAHARVDWLPQETILYDGAALNRRLDIDLSADATVLAVESFILGRAAMGEAVRDLRLTDHWRVRREGRLIYADALRLRGDAEAVANRIATLGGHRAFATVLFSGPDAGRHLAPLRSKIADTGGASLIRDGVLAARLTAPDGFRLRKALVPALEFLRGAPLPRPWSI